MSRTDLLKWLLSVFSAPIQAAGAQCQKGVSFKRAAAAAAAQADSVSQLSQASLFLHCPFSLSLSSFLSSTLSFSLSLPIWLVDVFPVLSHQSQSWKVFPALQRSVNTTYQGADSVVDQ